MVRIPSFVLFFRLHVEVISYSIGGDKFFITVLCVTKKPEGRDPAPISGSHPKPRTRVWQHLTGVPPSEAEKPRGDRGRDLLRASGMKCDAYSFSDLHIHCVSNRWIMNGIPIPPSRDTRGRSTCVSPAIGKSDGPLHVL